ncbi:hypothetical protein SESBI_07977 [Sesbania bispinosa]|nr:hypothetical protein SESBI_07977 [Sesbania bispinosa]
MTKNGSRLFKGTMLARNTVVDGTEDHRCLLFTLFLQYKWFDSDMHRTLVFVYNYNTTSNKHCSLFKESLLPARNTVDGRRCLLFTQFFTTQTEWDGKV